jgi:hypothetical protein
LSKPYQYLGSIEAIGQNAPLRLGAAAALAFPDSTMTVSDLRREAAPGRLMIGPQGRRLREGGRS